MIYGKGWWKAIQSKHTKKPQNSTVEQLTLHALPLRVSKLVCEEVERQGGLSCSQNKKQEKGKLVPSSEPKLYYLK